MKYYAPVSFLTFELNSIKKVTYRVISDEKNLFDGIKNVRINFNKTIEAQLPTLELEINEIISSKCSDSNKIEHTLDILLSLTTHSMCDELFVQLLEYYKTISAAGAEFYWNEYDK